MCGVFYELLIDVGETSPLLAVPSLGPGLYKKGYKQDMKNKPEITIPLWSLL